ncbi:hypothetical protein HYPSUDRAFT_221402 [Hypholoma sublateritium FD-334 SS-4]|uniref:F-box domain-containing protein n=1 Tax=Hypholoma sublateritium (strain FD-334 SS-4) TaxID=945553 RepID=A0A0D2QD43_HYPSF|nr:hypothetical protein HYPSUDRAFT_221402 [Hypholoma sublateritium FD-334 SS-4]
MDQVSLSSHSVLETLLKTNRPPTDQEREIILESMAPTNAKLRVIEAQISDTIAHIQALKSQVEQAERKLERLREEEAASLDTLAVHRRIFSTFRILPEDVLREICVTCVEADMPTLSYLGIPLPYVLAQISSGMRRIVLTTPLIWTSVNIETGSLYAHTRSSAFYEQAYSLLARRASQWFERAGALALTVSFQDPSPRYGRLELQSSEPDPSNILCDTFISYSTRWKEIRFNSRCRVLSAPMIRIAALTAVDVPLLQSVSLHLDLRPNAVLHNSVLTIPTLKRVNLDTDVIRKFTVNWGVLTSVTLRGRTSPFCYSQREIARILQQTKCLVFCDIIVGHRPEEQSRYLDKVDLPFLKTLIVSENPSETVQSMLDPITAPILEIFSVDKVSLDVSLAEFLKQSPLIQNLSLPSLHYINGDKISNTIGLLCHCPSLIVLSLGGDGGCADRLLRAFVEEGDAGVICPRLQYFDFTGYMNFSLQTLRLFLEGKQGEIAIPNVLPWKKVSINIGGIRDTKTYEQMLDLVSQKKAAGLDVELKELRQ